MSKNSVAHATRYMTPKEAADLANNTLDRSRDDDVKIFLREAPARDIQTFIHHLHVVKHDWFLPFARAALDIRLAEDAGIVAQKVVRLTWGLFWLTLALTFVAAVQLYIMLK
jgi:hypothetical protein